MDQLELKIDSLLGLAPYSLSGKEKTSRLLDIWRDELEMTGQRHAGLGNYIRQWPVNFRDANRVADLPFLPVAMLKANPPLSLVGEQEIKRTLTSSADCPRFANFPEDDQGGGGDFAEFHRTFPKTVPGCGRARRRRKQERDGSARGGHPGPSAICERNQLLFEAGGRG
jgi:hypothetical protein